MVGVSAGMVLGVLVMSYIANLFSLEIAMLAFALVNLIALALTIIYVPSMPVKEKMSYGSQFKILKDINLWWALIAVILLNGANFGVYSYLADYLERVSLLSLIHISSCSSSKNAQNENATKAEKITEAEAARPSADEEMDEGYLVLSEAQQNIVKKNNDFAFRLYQDVYKRQVSPQPEQAPENSNNG